MNIAEAIKMPESSIISGLKGKLARVKAWEPPAATDQYPVSKQSMLFKDETGEIWVNVKGHDEYNPAVYEGKDVELTPYYNKERKTWFGVKLNVYNGKVSINMTKTGKIELIKKEEAPTSEPAKLEKKSEEIKATIKAVEPTDWNAQERRELRAKAYNAALMTIYPILIEKLINPDGELPDNKDIETVLDYFAEEAYNFTIREPLTPSKETDIPF